MVPVMLGLYVSFLTIYTLLVKPQNWACYVDYFGFHVSCTCIFGPLFLKTLRMRRIFLAAEQCKVHIKGVSELSQVAFAVLIIGFQVHNIIFNDRF